MATVKTSAQTPAQPNSPYVLVVVHPFGQYQRGYRITDAAEINAVLAGKNQHHVHKTLA